MLATWTRVGALDRVEQVAMTTYDDLEVSCRVGCVRKLYRGETAKGKREDKSKYNSGL
jgi:hypothetical protein